MLPTKHSHKNYAQHYPQVEAPFAPLNHFCILLLANENDSDVDK